MPFSEDQIEELREIFDSQDLNADDKIELQEMLDAQRQFGQNPSVSDMKAFIRMADLDEDGGLTFDEFVSVAEAYEDEASGRDDKAALQAAFKMFDLNNSGKISANEFFKVMTELGEPLSREEALDAVKGADVDGDGYLSIDEFIEAISSMDRNRF